MFSHPGGSYLVSGQNLYGWGLPIIRDVFFSLIGHHPSKVTMINCKITHTLLQMLQLGTHSTTLSWSRVDPRVPILGWETSSVPSGHAKEVLGRVVARCPHRQQFQRPGGREGASASASVSGILGPKLAGTLDILGGTCPLVNGWLMVG